MPRARPKTALTSIPVPESMMRDFARPLDMRFSNAGTSFFLMQRRIIRLSAKRSGDKDAVLHYFY